MVQINLLPWREEARNRRKLRFLYIVGAFILLALLLVALIHLILAKRIDRQQKRNAFLQTQISYNQTVISDLEKEQKLQADTQIQIEFIQGLQGKSFSAVRLLNELVKIVPASISLTKVRREGNTVTLEGIAESSLDITLLMKKMAKSVVFKQPELTNISAKKEDESDNQREFQLKAELRE